MLRRSFTAFRMTFYCLLTYNDITNKKSYNACYASYTSSIVDACYASYTSSVNFVDTFPSFGVLKNRQIFGVRVRGRLVSRLLREVAKRGRGVE